MLPENLHGTERCPSNGHCHGQFLFIKHYGVICTQKLAEVARSYHPTSLLVAAYELSQEAHIERSEGLGLA